MNNQYATRTSTSKTNDSNKTTDPRAFLSVSALVNEGDISFPPQKLPKTSNSPHSRKDPFQLQLSSHSSHLPLLPRRCASTPPLTPTPKFTSLLETKPLRLLTSPIHGNTGNCGKKAGCREEGSSYFEPLLCNSPERCMQHGLDDGNSYTMGPRSPSRSTVPVPALKTESAATTTPPTTPTGTLHRKDGSSSSADSPRQRQPQTNMDVATSGKPRPVTQVPKALSLNPSTAAQFTAPQLATIKRCHEITQQFNSEIALLPKRMGDALWLELFSARYREAVANEAEKQNGGERNGIIVISDMDDSDGIIHSKLVKRVMCKDVGEINADKQFSQSMPLPRSSSALTRTAPPTSICHERSISEPTTSVTLGTLFKRPEVPRKHISHFRSSSAGNIVLPQMICDQESKRNAGSGKWNIAGSCVHPHPPILRTNAKCSPLANYSVNSQNNTTDRAQSGDASGGSKQGIVRKRTLQPKSHTFPVHTHSRSLSLDELKYGYNDGRNNIPTAFLLQTGRYRLEPNHSIEAMVGSVPNQRIDRLPVLEDQLSLASLHAANPTPKSHSRANVYPSQPLLHESRSSASDGHKKFTWSKQYIPTVAHDCPKSFEKEPCVSTSQPRPYVRLSTPGDTQQVHHKAPPPFSEQYTRPYHTASTQHKEEKPHRESKIPATTAPPTSFCTNRKSESPSSVPTVRSDPHAPFVYQLPPIAHPPGSQSFAAGLNRKRCMSPPWMSTYSEQMGGEVGKTHRRRKVARSSAPSPKSSLH